MYKKLQYFFSLPTAGGITLMITALLGLIVANSPLSELYFTTLNSYVFGLSILHWINDALMAIFFLYVGLELKREFLVGELATNSQRILPGLAALAGLAVPAVIYYFFNKDNAAAINGWAIPTATDIAFALGILVDLFIRCFGELARINFLKLEESYRALFVHFIRCDSMVYGFEIRRSCNLGRCNFSPHYSVE